MAQISKGDTFTDGQQVTGARLNQLVDSSVLLVGAITDQPNLTANTLQSTDSTIVNDAGVLKEATIGDFLNSNLPITTSSITGGAGVDIAVAPAAGQKFDVNGAFEATTSNTTGNATIGGTLVVTGGSTLTGNVIADNGFTSNGLANFTGTLQVGGTVGYVLYEVSQETITPWIASAAGLFDSVWTSSAFVKPADEIWHFDVSCQVEQVSGYTVEIAGRFSPQAHRTGQYLFDDVIWDSGNVSYKIGFFKTYQWVIGAGTSLASQTFKIDVWLGSGSEFSIGETSKVRDSSILTTGTYSPSVFRIYKYKTA